MAEDAWQQELVLAIRQPTDPRRGQPHERTHPLAPTRPYGSVWAFSPDDMCPTLDGAVTFVGSSFTQTLHMALYCWYAPRLAQEQSPHLRETTLREALTAIDPATQDAPYWQLWIDAALAGP